eukprot:6183208-Amphidinium_carterae.1
MLAESCRRSATALDICHREAPVLCRDCAPASADAAWTPLMLTCLHRSAGAVGFPVLVPNFLHRCKSLQNIQNC